MASRLGSWVGLIFAALLLGAAPFSIYPLSVSIAPTGGDSYIGTTLTNAGATHAWPFNDANSNSTTLGDVIGNSDLSIASNSQGYGSAPAIVSGSSASILTTSLSQQLNTGSGSNAVQLSATSPWSVAIDLLPTTTSILQNIWSTGNAIDTHTGVELYTDTTGRVNVAFGTGSTYNPIVIASSITPQTTPITGFTQGHRAYVTWTPTSGSTTGAGTARVSYDGGTLAATTVPAFSATTTGIGFGENVGSSNGSGAGRPYQGYASYLAVAPVAWTQTQIGAIDTALTTTTAAGSTTTGNNPTLVAAAISSYTGFDSEYQGYTDHSVEDYASLRNSDGSATQSQVDANPVTRLAKNLQVTQLRDGSNISATNTAYTALCADGIATALGINYNYGHSAITGTMAGVYGNGTYLTSAAAAGSTVLHVNSVSYTQYGNSNTTATFAAGNPIVLDIWGTYGFIGAPSSVPGHVAGGSETLTISAVNSSTKTITVTPALSYAHVSGALVDSDTGSVSDASSDAYALPVPLTVSQVTGLWDQRKTATGCYPGYSEEANEPDGSKILQTTDPSSHTGAAFYATLSVKAMETILAARASNAKYAGIKVIGVGLTSDNNYTHISQAAYDLSQQTSTVTLPLPIDAVSQHTGYDPYAPELANGVSSKASLPFVPYNGHSAYNQATTPLWNTEFTFANNTTNFACSSCMANDLGADDAPRIMFADIAHGVSKKLFDFPSNHVCSAGVSFCGDGFMDSQGRVVGGAYALMNVVKKMGEPQAYAANTCSDPSVNSTYNPPQLGYTATAPINTSTDKLVSYSFVKCDGTMWLALVRATEQAKAFQSGSGGGNTLTRAPFEAATITLSNPSSYPNVTVFQNDEYCDAPYPQPPLITGAAYETRTANPANRSCYQWWPAGSLTGSNQPTNPTVTSGSFQVKVNGMVLLIELTNGAPAAVPTFTPFPIAAVATPSATCTNCSFPAVPATQPPLFAPPVGT